MAQNDISDITKITQQLKEYKQLFNMATDPIIIFDLDGIILESNQRFWDIYGYTREEIIGRDIGMLHHPDEDMQRVYGNISKKTEELKSHFYLHVTKQGRKIPVEVRTSRITYNKKPVQVSNIRDITQRERFLEALQEGERKFRLAFESSSVGKALSFSNGPFFDVNRKLCEILEYSPDELIGTRATSLTHPDDLEKSRKAIKDMADRKFPNDTFTIEKRYLAKSGRVVWSDTTVSMLKDENQSPLYMFVEIVDITTRKNAEETNRQLRNYLSNIINSMPSILVGVNRDGIVTQWNRKAESITGYLENKVLGKRVDDLFPHFNELFHLIKIAIKLRKTQKQAKIHRQTGKETVFEDLTIYPLVTNGVEGAVIRIDDVTDQVRIEEMMIHSEKMMSLGGLAAGMAHEINNPLAGMMQSTQVVLSRLKNKLPANEAVARDLGIDLDTITEYMDRRGILKQLESIHSAGSRAAKTVQNMLSFARKNSSDKRACNVVELVENTLELADSDYDIEKKYDFKKITIQRNYENDLPAVYCEQSKIQQVILNLLKNAAQAFSDIDMPNGNPHEIRVDISSLADIITISIQDNGPGMDADTRKRIFEPFFTTKPPGKGTGLGLSVSYFIIVKDHGGQMDVSSSPGSGTTFNITLAAAV